MKIKVKLEKDHIELIKHFLFQEFNTKVGIDTYNVFDVSDRVFTAMAMILGLEGEAIPETRNDWGGIKYSDKAMERMMPLADYISQNLLNIEEIVHQFCDKGVKEGTYWCLDNQHIWHYEEEENEK